MKVGPKGHVVIPRTMRKALKIEPGSKVLFTLKNDKLTIQKTRFDGIAALKKIAKQINSNEKINLHEYEEELEQRNP